MIVGETLRAIRESKNLTQGEIEKRTGLLRCYISRIENSHAVPAIETLEKLARALEVPLYQLFYDGEEPPALNLPEQNDRKIFGSSKKEARQMAKIRRYLSRIDERELGVLMSLAANLARKTMNVPR